MLPPQDDPSIWHLGSIRIADYRQYKEGDNVAADAHVQGPCCECKNERSQDGSVVGAVNQDKQRY